MRKKARNILAVQVLDEMFAWLPLQRTSIFPCTEPHIRGEQCGLPGHGHILFDILTYLWQTACTCKIQTRLYHAYEKDECAPGLVVLRFPFRSPTEKQQRLELK